MIKRGEKQKGKGLKTRKTDERTTREKLEAKNERDNKT